MSPARAIIAFGSGPGIGNHTVSEFVSHGFTHVILLARNEDRLKNEDAPFVAKASSSVKVDTLRLDLSDIASIPPVLKKIDDLTEGEELEVVFFNAARIKPSDVLEVPVEEIHEDFKVCFSLFKIVRFGQMTDVNTDHKPRSVRRSPALHPPPPGTQEIEPLLQA